ncbi:MAG: hypothetical protein IIB04_03600 [Acidobacteria bacterium]|nr:hypothetical protein [Acidobacteriota bacterium]
MPDLNAALELERLTVVGVALDRVANVVRWTAVGIVIGVLGVVAFVMSVIGIFRVLDTAVDTEVAFAGMGGLFTLIGVFAWRKRIPKESREDTPHG